MSTQIITEKLLKELESVVEGMESFTGVFDDVLSIDEKKVLLHTMMRLLESQIMIEHFYKKYQQYGSTIQ